MLAADVIGFAESRLCTRDEVFNLPSINLNLLDWMKQHMKLGHIMDLLCMSKNILKFKKW